MAMLLVAFLLIGGARLSYAVTPDALLGCLQQLESPDVVSEAGDVSYVRIRPDTLYAVAKNRISEFRLPKQVSPNRATGYLLRLPQRDSLPATIIDIYQKNGKLMLKRPIESGDRTRESDEQLTVTGRDVGPTAKQELLAFIARDLGPLWRVKQCPKPRWVNGELNIPKDGEYEHAKREAYMSTIGQFPGMDSRIYDAEVDYEARAKAIESDPKYQFRLALPKVTWDSGLKDSCFSIPELRALLNKAQGDEENPKATSQTH